MLLLNIVQTTDYKVLNRKDKKIFNRDISIIFFSKKVFKEKIRYTFYIITSIHFNLSSCNVNS